MQFFSVKDFDKLQHYKDRNPPWIKLYNELLDSYEFGCLPDASKGHLLAIMLLASRSSNKLPYDAEWIGNRISATEKVDLNVLVKAGFLLLNQVVQLMEQAASTALAECLPREREREEKKESCPVGKPTRTVYSQEFEDKFWNPYPRTKTMSKLETWKQWQKLGSEDREQACQAIDAYKLELRKKPDMPVVHACRFLSQRRCEGLLAAATTSSINIRGHFV